MTEQGFQEVLIKVMRFSWRLLERETGSYKETDNVPGADVTVRRFNNTFSNSVTMLKLKEVILCELTGSYFYIWGSW